MDEWGSGYVADVPYYAGYYHDQAPAHLAYICAMKGYEPPALDRPFTYLELGCGLGLTTCLLAATNPLGKFYGVDFNPAHIAGAADIAAATGVANVTFLESSFHDLLQDHLADLPDFDVVTLHGVYTWIADEDRTRIVDILRRKLKPGGIAYVSYNSLPGWAEGATLQRLLYEVGKLSARRSDQQFSDALDFLETLRGAGVPYFASNESLGRILEIRKGGRLAYLTHEYMNANWQALYHCDIARELSAAKLQFVGSSHALDNFADLNFARERQELLARIGASEVKETLKDFFVPRLLRKDVYVRGARRMSAGRQKAHMFEMPLALIVARDLATLALRVPIGEIEVSSSAFVPVLDALADGTRTMAQLLAVSQTAEKTVAKAVEISGILIGSSQAAAALPPAAKAAAGHVRRVNRALAERACDRPIEEVHALAAPEIGGAIPASGVEMRVFAALAAGSFEDRTVLASTVWEPLAARGQKFIKDDRTLETEEENFAVVAADVDRILDQRCPVWERLGAL